MRQMMVGCVALALAGGTLVAGDNPVYEWQAERDASSAAANRARVERALAEAKVEPGKLTWFVVPAMSDVMRLGDIYPEDGTLRGELQVIAAKDEYESASFELFAFSALDQVEISVSPLRSASGAEIPADKVDLTVSKPWFQNGNGWLSYFADVGLKLTPELLLHDENLIKVELDPKRPANYARQSGKDGKSSYLWISEPYDLGGVGEGGSRLNLFDEQFADAQTLLPVTLRRDRFTQFVATVHVTAEQAAGCYRGAVTVRRGGKTLAEIPIAVRVLPFVLPEPHPFDDLEAPFTVALMSHNFNLKSFIGFAGGDKAIAEDVWEKSLGTYRAHNILNPSHFDLFTPGEQGEKNRERYRRFGFATNVIYSGGGELRLPWFARHYAGRLNWTEYRALEHAIARGAERINELFPGAIQMNGYGDEPGVGFVQAYRHAWEYALGTSLRPAVAGHAAVFNKGGHVYCGNPMGGFPEDPDMVNRISKWKQVNKDMRVNFYAGQHNGAENPQFVRYQHGLLGYLNGFNAVDNYEFGIGATHWNDLSKDLYKPMCVSYLCRSGLVETFAFLGFREAIDDIRYMTQLKRLCRDAEQSGDRVKMVAARKALHYIAQLDKARMDLNAIRLEVVRHILNLTDLLAAK